ncbi:MULTISPECIES: P-loop ATPase, Sll1717 family [Burkholderiales]|uniref:P-loop ATPase, Sll1717 family n=1 Tax=Burkholderiales TaxID=80840 RepID=UPI0029DD6E48|nr:hypothetical protein [Achromobacter sp.]MCG2601860.1 hypothetical protein [Achromobacter sp.]
MKKLKEIYLGSVDAKNELLNNSTEERNRFVSAFVPPPNLVVESYLSRNRYYILGLKGTGKTALLRYISIRLEEEMNAYSSFVLFKTDIDEDFKKTFSQASRTSIAEANSADHDGDEFEVVWRWLIYRKLLADIESNGLSIFQQDLAYQKFRSIVKSSDSDDDRAGVMKLIPKIRKGNIEISRDPKLVLDFDWSEEGKAKINFNRLVRAADEAFRELIPGEGRLNIFFDELELNYFNSKQYQRDSRLIRDLIVSVEKVNAICKLRGLQICIYCAIRSEVQNSVASLGKEINKPLTDFGSEIHWHRADIDDVNQPLLYIIDRRLREALPRSAEAQEVTVWQHFFPKLIKNRTPQEYILHHSWYRPRDVVRLLKSAQDQYPDETTFSYSVLNAIRKKYSTASWVEVTEELKTTYKADEIEAIKRLLYGFKKRFSLKEMKERIDDISPLYQEVPALLKVHRPEKVLADLYRAGVIGNISTDGRYRFSFRGDDEILLEYSCVVHTALHAHLSVSF